MSNYVLLSLRLMSTETIIAQVDNTQIKIDPTIDEIVFKNKYVKVINPINYMLSRTERGFVFNLLPWSSNTSIIKSKNIVSWGNVSEEVANNFYAIYDEQGNIIKTEEKPDNNLE